MTTFVVGKFEVNVWEGGCPVWTTIKRTDRDDMSISGISHTELADLEYAIQRAKREANRILPEGLRHEI